MDRAKRGSQSVHGRSSAAGSSSSASDTVRGDPGRPAPAGAQELLTLALVEASGPEEVPEWMRRLAASEGRRHERIKGLVGEPLVNGLYRVVAEDDLSQPITQ
jgi:hypothetical protein